MFTKQKIIRTWSRKAANIISSTDYYETKLCAWTCHRFFPVGTYKQLIEWYKKEVRFFTGNSINLDEYKGLSPENDQSYRYFMNTNLFNHVNINKSHICP